MFIKLKLFLKILEKVKQPIKVKAHYTVQLLLNMTPLKSHLKTLRKTINAPEILVFLQNSKIISMWPGF